MIAEAAMQNRDFTTEGTENAEKKEGNRDTDAPRGKRRTKMELAGLARSPRYCGEE